MAQRTGDHAIYRDEQAAGTDGGTFTAGAWRTRVLNTTQSSSGSTISLSSNQVTLTKGHKYFIEAYAPAYKTDTHTMRLYNTTTSTTAIVGATTMGQDIQSAQSMAEINGEVDMTAASANHVFELQHRCNNTQANTGFGLAWDVSETEVYAVIEIHRIDQE